MSSIDRIFLSEGCCSLGMVGDSVELWMALLLGVSFSGIFVLSYNILRRNRRDSIWPSSNLCTSPDCIRCRPDRQSVNRMIKANLNKHLETKTCTGSSSRLGIDRVCEAVSNHLSKERLGLHEKPSSYSGQNPTFFRFPRLTGRPWWNWDAGSDLVPSKYATDFRHLERNAHKIGSEFRSLDELFRNDPDVSGWQVNLPGGWRVYHLLDQGQFRTANCVRCPDTVLVLKRLKNLMVNCVFGFASFSVLNPGATIGTHCGSTNSRLRCHLGISVPDRCQITVSDESRSWTKHQCLLFDDSYPHSVSHHGSGQRVIFMTDFWHPEFSIAERTSLQNIFPPKNHATV